LTSRKEIDEIDIKIIKRLLANSRTSFAEIAKECGVSTLTIRNRFEQLKKVGIINGTALIVQSSAFGIEGALDTLIAVDPNQLEQFIKYAQNLTQEKEIFACSQVKFSERHNVTITIFVRNTSKIQQIVETLKRHPAVLYLETKTWTFIKNSPQNLDLQSYRAGAMHG
jgi:Lrp/AsnC family transcriptional regulator for asnA, asnC and gidA